MKIDQSPFHSKKLISLDKYFEEMVKLYDSESFPKVLLLNGKKGIGKFTLVLHFLNYIYSKKERTSYNLEDKLINTNSIFYNSLLNHSSPDIIFLKAEDGKNIKINDIRDLKLTLSRTSLSDYPRFTIVDEVEFLNVNSVNALLKTLEEPTKNNFFILINNQQANLIETISSRCIKSNIFLSKNQQKNITDQLLEKKKIEFLIEDVDNLTPGLKLAYNELFIKYKINNSENIFTKLSKLLYGYKKDKDKSLINMSIFLIDQFFYHSIKKNENKIDFLLNLKKIITSKIHDFILYNLNINSVLTIIELELKNVRR